MIDIAVGQETTIALRSNLSTGYGWEVASTTNLRVIGDVTEERPRNSMPGAGGMSLVSFRIVTRGRAGITLRYVPPGGDRPQRTLVYRFVGI